MKKFLSEYSYAIVAFLVSCISMFLLVAFTSLNIFLSLWVGFIIGIFTSSISMFVVNRASDKYKSLNIEANRPDITMPIKEKNQYDEDITVILSFSRCLEGLPHDRLPNESDLKHPIKQIEGAINRQKANPKIPEHLRQTLLLSETFLALYKN